MFFEIISFTRKDSTMKLFLLIGLIMTTAVLAQNAEPIALKQPNLKRGIPVMQALSLRKSTREFVSKPLDIQDLSDLLWAANGINRPDEGKRTAPSAINAQDIDIYVLMETAAYLYNPEKNILEHVADGDFRKLAADRQETIADAPLFLLLVSETARFQRGDDDQKMTWAGEDAGIVSQNISIFCASENLATVVRAIMDRDGLRKALNLKDTQKLMLNHPVSYMPQ